MPMSCQSDEEFQRTYFTYIPDGRRRQEAGVSQWLPKIGDLPLAIDWRRAGVVTEVKQQVPFSTSTTARVWLEEKLDVYNIFSPK